MPTPTANPSVPFDVLLEDPRFVVLGKPVGVVSEPGLGHRDDSLLNGAFARWGAALARLGESHDHGLVHRLDRDTSGALIVALDAAAHEALRAQFEARPVGKRYLAIVEGRPPRPEGTTSVPLEEARRGDLKISLVAPRAGGKPAVTHWKTIAATKRRALLEVEIETGRLHQIRAHLAHLGCPVVGDRVYRVDLPPNTSAPPKGRPALPLALHALKLSFRHPADARAVTVTCPVPESFRTVASESGLSLPADAR